MHIALAQINTRVGDFSSNLSKVRDHCTQAIKTGADLIVFPELTTCGYPPLDLLNHPWFVEKNQLSQNEIIALSEQIGIVFGTVSVDQATGRRYNSAIFAHNGKILHVHHKMLLPYYDVFDESRYFDTGTQCKTVTFNGRNIAITICEDLWASATPNVYYDSDPVNELLNQPLDLVVNIAASPFHHHHFENRLAVLRKCQEHLNAPVVYVNQVGAHTDLVFDGGSLMLNNAGEIVSQPVFFKEELQLVKTSENVTEDFEKPSREEGIHKALKLGIKDYFGKQGFSKAVVGLSGGIDSALTLTLACQALGIDNVIALLLPSMFSSDHSISDSVKLCETLGCKYETLNIEQVYDAFAATLDPIFKGTSFDIAEENIQARIRGTILMAYSNKFGHLLLNTTNKSEMAVGYGTLYGDMAGALSVLGDVYKTQVFDLARYINKDEEIIPNSIITKPPSAELRPDQKDTDSLPEYDIVDAIVKAYIEQQLTPKEIVEQTEIHLDDVLKVIRLINQNEYKRYQAAPVIRVSPKAFGIGRRMPLVAKYEL